MLFLYLTANILFDVIYTWATLQMHN